MPRTTRPSLLALIAFFLAQGCYAATAALAADTFRPQQSAKDARQQLDDWVPASTPLADAVKTLQARGFTCQDARPATADIRSATLCTLAPPPPLEPAQRETAPPTPVHWFITLNSTDGSTVSGILVGRTPRDLGG